jgi:hypothetical protein
MKRREFIILLGGVLLAGGALLATASIAQGIGRWIISTRMPSSRTEVAVAEVGGERNGQYRHGERTKAAIAERQKFSALLKMLRAGLE